MYGVGRSVYKVSVNYILFACFRRLLVWFLFYIAVIWISGCGGSRRSTIKLNALPEGANITGPR